MSKTPLNLVAEDVHISYRSYLDPQVDLRDRLKRGRTGRRRHVTVDAVRGASFELRAGESIGLIGHNGAGKSSLLLGLAGLLPLKSGSVLARSRPTLLGVASVLNMALSGRRNIEIGCLAAGISQDEIGRRMGELIEFAGLEDAIDLPLKAYSSGMRARLSFTVATVNEPEVLLVDEALAVGDAEFRAKATGRLEEIRRAAGSVVVVSHNMAEIERMCDRALWLDNGQVLQDGTARRLIRLYGATRSNPDLMDSLRDDDAGSVGPLRSFTLQQIKERRYRSEQVEAWETPRRAALGGFPSRVARPETLDTSAVSTQDAQRMRQVHALEDRTPFDIGGALLRDWLLDPDTGTLIAEWPSADEERQALVVGETFSPLLGKNHDAWRESEKGVFIDRSLPREDGAARAVYCWSRWPNDPVHWWTDVATRAFLASTDRRLDDLPILTSQPTAWQRDALAALGIDLDRIWSPQRDEKSLVRIGKCYFGGALTFGPRDRVSLDESLAEAARVAREHLGSQAHPGGSQWIFAPQVPEAARRILNQDELDAVLREFGITVLSPDLSFAELVHSFETADVVVSLSGGGMFGTLFTPAGASVVELQPPSFLLTTGRALSSLGGRHHHIVACPTPNDASDASQGPFSDDIEVPCAALRSLLESLAAVDLR